MHDYGLLGPLFIIDGPATKLKYRIAASCIGQIDATQQGYVGSQLISQQSKAYEKATFKSFLSQIEYDGNQSLQATLIATREPERVQLAEAIDQKRSRQNYIMNFLQEQRKLRPEQQDIEQCKEFQKENAQLEKQIKADNLRIATLTQEVKDIESGKVSAQLMFERDYSKKCQELNSQLDDLINQRRNVVNSAATIADLEQLLQKGAGSTIVGRKNQETEYDALATKQKKNKKQPKQVRSVLTQEQQPSPKPSWPPQKLEQGQLIN